MIRSLLGRFMGGGSRGRTTAPRGGSTSGAGGSSTDAAIGRGVRGLFSRFTRR